MALDADTTSFSHKLSQLSDGFEALCSNPIYSQPQFAESFSSTSVDLSADQTRRPLKAGINVPTLAFFRPDTEDVDVEAVARHAVRLARAGISSITTQGSTGEAVHLTHRERKLITSTTRKALDDAGLDRKSTRLNSSHSQISYAV